MEEGKEYRYTYTYPTQIGAKRWASDVRKIGGKARIRTHKAASGKVMYDVYTDGAGSYITQRMLGRVPTPKG